jgi:hypothetical protein
VSAQLGNNTSGCNSTLSPLRVGLFHLKFIFAISLQSRYVQVLLAIFYGKRTWEAETTQRFVLGILKINPDQGFSTFEILTFLIG